jgi:hypothetical protein
MSMLVIGAVDTCEAVSRETKISEEHTASNFTVINVETLCLAETLIPTSIEIDSLRSFTHIFSARSRLFID